MPTSQQCAPKPSQMPARTAQITLQTSRIATISPPLPAPIPTQTNGNERKRAGNCLFSFRRYYNFCAFDLPPLPCRRPNLPAWV